jgi:replication fork protection complex subunit Tof1/Swi1
MSQSSDEETKDAAEVLLNKIYYQGDVLETALAVFTLWRPEMRGQPITFLDCTIHFAYVLLRMLEKYSKSKSFMFVRKRTAQKKQKKKDNADAPIPEEYGDEEEDVAPQRDLPSYSERGFTFTAFEKVSLLLPTVELTTALRPRGSHEDFARLPWALPHP